MLITDLFINKNEYSRPGKKLLEVKGIILHWVGVPEQTARTVQRYFDIYCPKDKHYSSAHYIIDFTGEIIHAVPDDEVAYHCGSSKIDPDSKVIYTDWAREKFGKYANINKETTPSKIFTSPNYVTLGIELCTIDEKGNFRDATIHSAIELVASLLIKYNLTIKDIGTHKMVVGWKDCPLLWTKNNLLFEAFLEDVDRKMHPNKNYEFDFTKG
jgi:N-acetylmuramoyl-L-alanine amidase CwlA